VAGTEEKSGTLLSLQHPHRLFFSSQSLILCTSCIFSPGYSNRRVELTSYLQTIIVTHLRFRFDFKNTVSTFEKIVSNRSFVFTCWLKSLVFNYKISTLIQAYDTHMHTGMHAHVHAYIYNKQITQDKARHRVTQYNSRTWQINVDGTKFQVRNYAECFLSFLKRQFNKQEAQLVMSNLMNCEKTVECRVPYVQNVMLLYGRYFRKCNLIYIHKSYSLPSTDFHETL
jgi:hypothetical protein